MAGSSYQPFLNQKALGQGDAAHFTDGETDTEMQRDLALIPWKVLPLDSSPL